MKPLKILKIDNNQGYFFDTNTDFSPVDKITKENLYWLVDLTLCADVEFDEYDENAIKNQAHQIIYRSIYEKLVDLRERKKEFTDEYERLYLQEYERYRKDLSLQGPECDVVNHAP